MKVCFLFLVAVGLFSCNNDVRVEIKTDSLKKSLDTSLEKIKDSVKAKGERTLDNVTDKIKSLKKEDSISRKTN